MILEEVDLEDIRAVIDKWEVREAWDRTSKLCSKNSHTAQCMRCVFNQQCGYKK